MKKSTRQTDRRKALRVAESLEAAYRDRIAEGTARKLINFAVEEVTGRPAAQSTLEEHFKNYLQLKRQSVRNNSYLRYKDAIDSFLTWAGPKRIREEIAFFSRNDVEAWKNTLVQRLSASSANGYLRTIRAAFADAEKRGYIHESPARHVEKFAGMKTVQREPFTLPEIKKLLDVAKGREWEGIILAGLYTGQRLVDLATLSWNQIDLEAGEITFLTRKTNRTVVVPIAEPLTKWLMDHAGDEPFGHVFPEAAKSVNRSSRTNTLSNWFHDLMAAAGLCPKRSKEATKDGRSRKRELSPKSFHSLRYSATSLLKRAGISNAVAMDIIGHDSEAVSRIYTNIDTDTKRKAIAKLPDVRE